MIHTYRQTDRQTHTITITQSQIKLDNAPYVVKKLFVGATGIIYQAASRVVKIAYD